MRIALLVVLYISDTIPGLRTACTLPHRARKSPRHQSDASYTMIVRRFEKYASRPRQVYIFAAFRASQCIDITTHVHLLAISCLALPLGGRTGKSSS